MALSKIRNDSLADTAVHGRRNIIINGAMQIAQRATSKTAQTADAIHTVDRFFLETSGATFDIAQVSDAPDGFQYSQKVTMSGAFTPTASQYFIPFEQRIEKQNLTHLAYGTSNAKSVTLSFWIKSNKTGTYVVEFSNNHDSNKWSQSYTIDAADTWEHKTLTWTGDTSGSLGTGNTSGATFFWWMTAGTTFTSGALSGAWETATNANRAVGVPTSLADDDEFYLTGVQLEVGDKATPFEHRSYGEELALCQRYYQRYASSNSGATLGVYAQWNGDTAYMGYHFQTTMRASPSFGKSSETHFRAYQATESGDLSLLAGNGLTPFSVELLFKSSVPIDTAGEAGWLRFHDTGAYIDFDAEL